MGGNVDKCWDKKSIEEYDKWRNEGGDPKEMSCNIGRRKWIVTSSQALGALITRLALDTNPSKTSENKATVEQPFDTVKPLVGPIE